MRISDWSSDVCSSDLVEAEGARAMAHALDLSDIPATEAWFKVHGDVDILHNNAGVVSGLPQFRCRCGADQVDRRCQSDLAGRGDADRGAGDEGARGRGGSEERGVGKGGGREWR